MSAAFRDYPGREISDPFVSKGKTEEVAARSISNLLGGMLILSGQLLQ
jgi:hypothetical protein